MKRYAIYSALLMALPLAAGAQTGQTSLANEGIAVENVKVERANDMLMLDVDLNMTQLDIPSNMRFVFTPLVGNDGQSRTMPQIVVNGRRADISYQRGGYKDFSGDVTVVRRKNNTNQTVHYHAAVPYEQWMANSDVAIAEDLCGCNKVIDQDKTVLRRLRKPVMPYLHPHAEAIKIRKESGSAYIDFPVNKITLYPEYRNNPVELQKIVGTINRVKEDKYTTITHVDIHGYASPESPYSHNAYLAENRAKTLKNHVRDLVALHDTIFSTSSTPEDWAGLRKKVADSDIDNREAILALIDDQSLAPDDKEQKIKQAYPKQYRYMLDNWYPALRHSDYVVTYAIRPLSMEEAKDLLKTKPQYLSLEEMFLVAQTYEPGSVEFNNVMETAAQIYPDNPVANINAACSRMENSDFAGARHYLDRAGNGADALHARGVMAILEGKAEEGRTLLQQAKDAGAEGAAENLNLLGN